MIDGGDARAGRGTARVQTDGDGRMDSTKPMLAQGPSKSSS